MTIKSAIGPAPVLEACRLIEASGQAPGASAIARMIGASRQVVEYQLGKLRAAGVLNAPSKPAVRPPRVPDGSLVRSLADRVAAEQDAFARHCHGLGADLGAVRW